MRPAYCTSEAVAVTRLACQLILVRCTKFLSTQLTLEMRDQLSRTEEAQNTTDISFAFAPGLALARSMGSMRHNVTKSSQI